MRFMRCKLFIGTLLPFCLSACQQHGSGVAPATLPCDVPGRPACPPVGRQIITFTGLSAGPPSALGSVMGAYGFFPPNEATTDIIVDHTVMACIPDTTSLTGYFFSD